MSASDRGLRITTVLASAMLLLATTVTSGARAAPGGASCGGERPWIAVDLDRIAEAGGATFRAAILGHLNAGLGGYGLHACSKSLAGARPPLAEIKVDSHGADNVRVSVEVRDAVTAKRVARDIDVSGYTREGRAFAIAATAEELVRASWAELRLRARRLETPPPPPEVAQVVEDSLAAETPRGEQNQLGTRLAIERFSGGQTHFGADAFFDHWFNRRLGFGVGVGPRFGIEAEHGAAGTVASRALGSELAALLSIVATDKLGVSLELGGRTGVVVFEGRPNARAEIGSDRASAPFASVRAGFRLSYAPEPRIQVALRAGAGLAVLGAEATANGRAVTAVAGWEAHAGLAVGALF